MAKDRELITIKRYADRLYDTGAAGYVTLGDLAERIRDGETVVIYDAKTRQDVTRSVLNQIIVEQA